MRNKDAQTLADFGVAMSTLHEGSLNTGIAVFCLTPEEIW